MTLPASNRSNSPGFSATVLRLLAGIFTLLLVFCAMRPLRASHVLTSGSLASVSTARPGQVLSSAVVYVNGTMAGASFIASAIPPCRSINNINIVCAIAALTLALVMSACLSVHRSHYQSSAATATGTARRVKGDDHRQKISKESFFFLQSKLVIPRCLVQACEGFF